jgi:diguanylate cyclase (GGDEF)-like protein
VASLASAGVWLISDMAAGNLFSQPVIYAWNTLMGLGFFVIVALLLSTLRRALERERELAHTDYLTGALNSRFFFDLLQMEINRSQRYKHPFTIAYIDIDNFKTVNDLFGHTTGDQVLCAVVNQARKHLRKTDVVARLGGDEFAVLLPETNQESAQVVLSKLQCDILVEMQQSNWPVTLSIGVLTCIDAPHTTDEIVRMVDDLMYSVKRGSKNAIKYSTYTG